MGAPRVAVVGGGPAGLMAAEAARAAGAVVTLYDGLASVGRKFLLAGKGGLNLTHGEPLARLLTRYGPEAAHLEGTISAFDNEAVRAWALGLGIETFVGTSGRVFPRDLKAAPLLRRWLARLRRDGVGFALRHRWLGFDADGALRFDTPSGEVRVASDAVVLALGGASWPALGADGAWCAALAAHGVAIAPLRAANCGFERAWSAHLVSRWAGTAVKNVAARAHADAPWTRGEFLLTESGVEGSLVYALSRPLRGALESTGRAILEVDLLPERDATALARALVGPRTGQSLAKWLERRAGLRGVKAALLRELAAPAAQGDAAALAEAIKRLPITLHGTRPLAEAISTAGGVRFAALTPDFMLRALPGVFCAGEMLDWEAPTGGYLLTACLATGRAVGAAAAAFARGKSGPVSGTANFG
ncbi:MAG: TIGR03862 family flavoprotein [Gammaproteobacteria bacterium]|nr:TIGR03862 family flavoprotein [Gammaproteobacteria bacterium]